MLRLKEMLYQLYWQVMKISWRFVDTKEVVLQQLDYSIGITTYIERYEALFKPYFLKLAKLFPDTQIIVLVNGNHDQKQQDKYLSEMHHFLRPYKNVTLVVHQQPQSLSRLWNEVILNSKSSRVLICNEDLDITPYFRAELESSGIQESSIALINNSWSHYMISKELIKKVGWFDERFPTIGNEDEDYESRLVLAGEALQFFKFRGIRPIVTIPEYYSYGENLEIINKKYLKSNKDFFDTKWEMSSAAQEGFVFVRILGKYVKMKTGMETPEFYDLNKL